MTERRPNILWLDNDRGFLHQHRDFLASNGFDVVPFETAIEAEQAIRDPQASFDLLILDVMVPTWSADEEITYSPEETDQGYQTGLVFWKRNKELLATRGTPVLVFTVRLDESIRQEFKAAGLPDANFASKNELTKPPEFLDKVRSLMRSPEHLT